MKDVLLVIVLIRINVTLIRIQLLNEIRDNESVNKLQKKCFPVSFMKNTMSFIQIPLPNVFKSFEPKFKHVHSSLFPKYPFPLVIQYDPESMSFHSVALIFALDPVQRLRFSN